MSKLKFQIVIFLLSLLPAFVMAEGVPLASASQVLLVGGEVLSKVMWAACIIVGIALIAAGFTQFQIHRRNPKLVPLTTPVLYLILGVCAIAIPFFDRITDFVGNDKKKMERSPAVTKDTNYSNDIDAPLN